MTSRRSPHERGAIQLGRPFILLLLAAAILAVWVGFPAATKAFKLRRATIILANRCLDHNNNCEGEITRYMSEAYTQHGVTLRRGDISVRGEPTAIEIHFEVQVMLPFELPLVNKTIYRRYTVKGGAERRENY